MSPRFGASRSNSAACAAVRRSAVTVLAAGALLGGTALTPALLTSAASAEESAAVTLRAAGTGPIPAVDAVQVHAQARALLTDLTVSDSPRAHELARKLVGLGVSPATQPAGWRQQAVDVSDRLHAVHGTHPSLDVVAVELAAAGFGPTPADLRLPAEAPAAGPPGDGPVGVLGGLADVGHKAVDAVGDAGGAVADVVTGPAPTPSSAPAASPVPAPPRAASPPPATPAPSPVVPQAGRTPPMTSAPAATPAPPPSVPVQLAAVTATPAPSDSSSDVESEPSTTTARLEEQGRDHGQENSEDRRSDAASRATLPESVVAAGSR